MLQGRGDFKAVAARAGRRRQRSAHLSAVWLLLSAKLSAATRVKAATPNQAHEDHSRRDVADDILGEADVLVAPLSARQPDDAPGVFRARSADGVALELVGGGDARDWVPVTNFEGINVDDPILFDDADDLIHYVGGARAARSGEECEFAPRSPDGEVGFAYAARVLGESFVESIAVGERLVFSVGRRSAKALSLLRLAHASMPDVQSDIACLAALGELEDIAFGAAALASMLDRETCSAQLGSVAFAASSRLDGGRQVLVVESVHKTYGRDVVELAVPRMEGVSGSGGSCRETLEAAALALASSVQVNVLPGMRSRTKDRAAAFLRRDWRLSALSGHGMRGDDFGYFSLHLGELLSAPRPLFDTLGILSDELQQNLLRPPAVAPAA